MIEIRKLTLTDMLESAVAAFRNLVAMQTWRDKDSRITYPELLDQSLSVAQHIVGMGLERNDRVAILGESCPHWGLAYLAINRAGCITVPILPNFSKAEVEAIIAHSGASLIVVNSRNASKVKDCGIPVIRMEDMVAVDPVDGVPFKDLGGVPTRFYRLTESQRAALDLRALDEDDVVSIIYTSGTTGKPKAVMLTNRNVVWNAYVCSTPFIKIRPGWNALSILPMSHVYEFTIGFLLLIMNGVQIVYLGKAPSTDSLMPALKEVQPEVMLSVPLLIEKIYRRALAPKIKEGTKLGRFARNRLTAPIVYRIIGKKVKTIFGGRLRFFGIGGAPFDSEAEAFFHRIHFPYALGYGLTETAPFIAGCGPKDQVVGTLGPVLDGLDVKLDPDTQEVLVKGPSVMKGYYLDEDLTREVFTEDGYFRTGDIGEFRKGRLAIRGRCKTMILGPSGENIYPENIEFLINSEEDVLESLVVDDADGLTAMIRVDIKALKRKGMVAMDTIEAYLNQIKNHVNEKLSTFSRIRRVEVQDEPFERTPTEKIKRFLYQRKGRGQSKA